MQNQEVKAQIGLGSILGMIFFCILFMAMFFSQVIFEIIAPPTDQISDSKKASAEVAEALVKLDSVTLDTSILKSAYFQKVTILPTFPTDSQTLANFGKTNPFVGNFSVVSAPAATSSVGGVIFSQQRSVNNNNSIVPIQNGRAQTPQGRR